MAKFIISAFADEASNVMDEQISTLKELGIGHIEPRNADGLNVSNFTEAQARELHSKLSDAGISLSALGSPIGKIDISDDMDAHISALENALKVAQILGARYIRMFSFFVPEGHEEEHEEEVFRRMERMIKTARGSGVQLVHENEKAIYGATGAHCLRLMEQFAPELGFVFDPSNFVQCEQDTKDCFRRLAPYITYMHMKDSLYVSNAERNHRDMGFKGVSDMHRPVGQGDGNVSWIIDQLIASDYSGFMTLEPHLSSCPTITGSPKERFVTAAHALIDLIESKGQQWE